MLAANLKGDGGAREGNFVLNLYGGPIFRARTLGDSFYYIRKPRRQAPIRPMPPSFIHGGRETGGGRWFNITSGHRAAIRIGFKLHFNPRKRREYAGGSVVALKVAQRQRFAPLMGLLLIECVGNDRHQREGGSVYTPPASSSRPPPPPCLG